MRNTCVLLAIAAFSPEGLVGDIARDEVPGNSLGISELRSWLAGDQREAGAAALRVPLSMDEAGTVINLLGKDRLARLVLERRDEVERKSLIAGDKTLRWLEKTFREEPAEGRSLWISLHGGGAVPQAVNDEQWLNHIRLYEPAEGIYIAPRAPTDTWNLWHEEHIDPLFQRLIEDFVALRGVNPNKVYLIGYSAGGDGVWHLAPRMADQFAGAAMMAGHPNGAELYGLRNLPFAIFMGANDGAFDRNKIAAEKVGELDRLSKDDPSGYVHMYRIYEGLGHWMNGKDAEALPWMAKFHRNPWPKKIVWVQDDVTHDRFYWLKIPDKTASKEGQKIIATVEGQTIRLDGDVPSGTSLLLSDELLDLDQAVSVIVNGSPAISTKLSRTAAAIQQSLEERLDLPATATAIFVLP